MATEFKWKSASEALTTALGSQLDGLANSTTDTTGFSVVSSEIPNYTDQYQYISLELILSSQLSARTAGGYVSVCIALAMDGTTMEHTGNKAFMTPLAIFPLDAATTSRRLARANIPIPPVDFRLYLFNASGQTLGGVGNSLTYRRYNEQSVTF